MRSQFHKASTNISFVSFVLWGSPSYDCCCCCFGLLFVVVVVVIVVVAVVVVVVDAVVN